MSESTEFPVSCLNCHAVLTGPYCPRCGQKRRTIIRFFDEVALEVLNNSLGYDARLWRTIRQLLLQPGQVARDYVDGKRARFVSPIRLFLAVSIAFVFVEQLFFEPEGWLTIVGAVAGRIGDQIFSEATAAYLAAAQANRAFIQETFLSSLTLILMPMLPLQALILKALFYRRRPLYMEHLVFVLYMQAATSLILLGCRMLPHSLLRAVLPEGAEIPAVINYLTATVGWGLASVYGLFSVKRFYGEGWAWTILKQACARAASLLLYALTLVLAFLWLARNG